MAIYKRVKTLDPVDAAYLAGLIDGEGSVSLSRKHRNENRQLVISISSTERQLLTYAQDVLGAGKITNKRTYRAHHTPSVTFAITNRQALDLLKQVAPYLKSYKADRAAFILQHYVRLTPRNGKYSSEQKTEREVFTERLLALRPNAR